jgi:hypothetical protein
MNRSRLIAILAAVAVMSAATGWFVLSQHNKPLPLFMRWRGNEGGQSRQINFLCDRRGNLLLIDLPRNTLLIDGPGEASGFAFRPSPSGAHIERNGKTWDVPNVENTLFITEASGVLRSFGLPAGFVSRIVPTTRPYEHLLSFPPDDVFSFLLACCHPDDAEGAQLRSCLGSRSTRQSGSPTTSRPA